MTCWLQQLVLIRRSNCVVLSTIFLVAAIALLAACSAPTSSAHVTGRSPKLQQTAQEIANNAERDMETATFGAGCFWCVEAVFQELDGVQSVKSGYSGGAVDNPTYEQVCSGRTGHAEVCQIVFDPKKISFTDLLEVFWKTHDPTTLNQQGPDHGTQYRSVVFYHSVEQKELAEKYKAKLGESGAFDGPIVTEITEFKKFYPGEKYHDNYFRDNPNAGYCRVHIRPKMEKFRKVFADKLKK